MNGNYYVNHVNYEKLISRSLRRPTTIRDVERLSAYLKFVNIRDGLKFRNENHEDQFDVLKKYLLEALTKFLKRRLNTNERATISELIVEIQSANRLNQIDLIVQKGLAITNRFK